jgi:hypothetical protein
VPVLVFIHIFVEKRNMARFIVEYDILIGEGTKRFILDEGIPNIKFPGYYGQYVLSDIIKLLVDHKDAFNSDTYAEDINYLRDLERENVKYIEVG